MGQSEKVAMDCFKSSNTDGHDGQKGCSCDHERVLVQFAQRPKRPGNLQAFKTNQKSSQFRSGDQGQKNPSSPRAKMCRVLRASDYYKQTLSDNRRLCYSKREVVSIVVFFLELSFQGARHHAQMQLSPTLQGIV